jgi:hypothetical protein
MSTPSVHAGQRQTDGASYRERGFSRVSYPFLMIDGVYRYSSAMGVHSYSLASIPKTSSKYRLRVAVRAARKAISELLAHSRGRVAET